MTALPRHGDEAFHAELWDARQMSMRRVRWVVRRLERAAKRGDLTVEEDTRLRAYRQVLSERTE